MVPAPSFEHLERLLNEETIQLEHGFAEGIPRETKTVGFIVFDQNFSRSPIRDLVENLDMLHRHSGTHMHFFLCGVSKFGPNDRTARELGKLNGVPLYHSASAAGSFITAFEREIPNWRYNLGFDLILVDVAETDGGRRLDYSSAVYFRIEELIKQGIIDRPSELLGKLVKFVRDSGVENAAGFKDELKSVFETNWLKALILAMFPKHVGKLARAEAVLGGGAAVPK